MKIPRQKRILVAIFSGIYIGIAWAVTTYFTVNVYDALWEKPRSFIGIAAMWIVYTLMAVADQ